MATADADATQGSSLGVPRWARLLIAVAAALELTGGLKDVPILLGDTSEIPGPGLGGWIITAKIALQPVFSLLALVFAANGKIRHALVAMAAVVAINWLSYMPSVALHGLELQGDGAGGLITLFEIVLAPLMAIAVVALAFLDRRLTLATLLAVFHTFLSVLLVILFAIGVAIYGF